MSSEFCRVCDRVVTGRQHAVQCDVCDKWQHRTCGTGINQADYRLMVRGEKEIVFKCSPCNDAIQVEEVSTVEEMDTSAAPEVSIDSVDQPHADFTVNASFLSVSARSTNETEGPTRHSPNSSTESVEQPNGDFTVHPSFLSESARSTNEDVDITRPSPNRSIESVEQPNADFTVNASFLSVSTSSTIEDAGPTRPFNISCSFGENDTVIEESDIEDPGLSDTVLEDVPTTYTVVDNGTKRGAKKLISSDGYTFSIKKSSETTTLWRCTVRSTHTYCKATISERKGNFIVGAIGHCHQADPGALKKVLIHTEVISHAKSNVHRAAGDLVDEAFTNNVTETDFSLPKPTNLIRAANRVRQHMRPSEPKDLHFKVDMDFLKLEDFLVADITTHGGGRSLVFATDSQLGILKTAKRWFMDGTYKIRREPFQQLYSIHAFLKKGESIKQVPLCFILMIRKRKIDYVEVFEKLVQRMGGVVSVEGFMMDFEPAAWEAVKEVFPGTQLKGCSFHWGQAVWRKVVDEGLKTTYNKREGVYILIRKTLAIPFLPAGHIRGAFQALRDQATTPKLDAVFTYLENTWLTNPVWAVKQWSVFGQSVRTNNDVEGWHHRLNGKAGKARIQFYVLVPLMRREASLVPIQHQLVSEEQLTRFQRVHYRKMQGEIARLWDKYEQKDIATEDFLKTIGDLCAPALEK